MAATQNFPCLQFCEANRIKLQAMEQELLSVNILTSKVQ